MQTPPTPPAVVAPAHTSAVELPFESLGSLIVVEARINDKPARLILDTCAGVSLLTPEAAKKFAVGGGMPIQIGGAGGDARKAELVQLGMLSCAGRTEKQQPAVILALPANGGKRADGVLGMPFLSRYVVRIDYAKKRVSLLAPGTPTLSGSALTMTRRMGLPEVELEIDGLRGKVRVDTGYGGTFTYTTPTVRKEKLREKYPRRIEIVAGQGIGGASIGEAVRAGALRLGELTLKDVTAQLSRDTSGVLADTETIGLLGGETLSRFTVTFDFPAGKLYLQKNARFDEPFIGPRAGFSGTTEGDGSHVVRTVTPDSPATEAGVLVGDKLLAIDGKSVGELGQAGAREALRVAPGTKVRLLLRGKDGKERTVELTLRELL